jgi:hypothetical protein
MRELLIAISVVQGLAILAIVGFCTWGAYHFLYDFCERRLNLKSQHEKKQDIPLNVAIIVSKVVAINLPIILVCAWCFAYLAFWKLNVLKVADVGSLHLSWYGVCELICSVVLLVASIAQYISAKSISRGKIKYRNLLMISWSVILLTVFNLNSYVSNFIVQFFLDGAALFCFWVFALRPYDATSINKNCKNFSYPVKLILLIIFIAIVIAPKMNMGSEIITVASEKQVENTTE